MQPSLLSVFLDYRCNFSCAHCSVGSSPSTRMKMPDELLDSLFDQLAEVPTIKLVVFTGGEATLHPQMLKRGLSRAKALGMATRVVSNGWWAKDPRRAQAYLEDLRAHGLDEINTSYDDFHEPFIKIDRIAHLIAGAIAIGMPVGMGVINDRNAKFDAAAVKAILAERLGMTWPELRRHVSIVDDFPTPSGTGENLDVAGMDAGEKLDLGCPDIMKTISVHPTGSIKGCCGHGQLYQKDLAIGNLNEERLVDILDRSTQNLFYWWLHYQGPRNILKRLGVSGTYASMCHACNDLLGNHRDELIAFLTEHRDEVLCGDVLASDHMVRMAEWVATQEDLIVGRMKDFATA